jgi:hypothetical protein
VGLGSAGNTSAIPLAVECLLDDEPSLNKDEVSASLDLRIACAAAVEEFVANASNVGLRSRAAIAAASIATSLRYRQLSGGDFSAARAQGLLNVAEKLLDALDRKRRDRKDTAYERFKDAAAATDSDMAEAVRQLVGGLHDEMLKDREELQALWWVIAAYSHTLSKRFSELGHVDAGIISGLELADIVKFPPTLSFGILAGKNAQLIAGADDRVSLAVSLAAVATHTWDALFPRPAEIDIVKRNPAVFPLSYCSWKRRAGVDPSIALGEPGALPSEALISSLELASQTFAERSLLSAVVKG